MTVPAPLTAAQRARVEEVLAQALDGDLMVRDADERHRWLVEATAGDSGVLREVTSLLAEHVRAGRFLAEPIGQAAAMLLADEPANMASPNVLERSVSQVGLDTPLLVPRQVVGPYVIEREIGRGGMGRVYLARDTRLGRSVALKALAPHLAARSTERERFRREAAAAAALAHPGICTVFAFEEIDGRAYIASEFIEGRTLRQEIAEASGLPLADDVMRVARDLASALASAHARGVAHRDLKPDNVMRTADGRTKVLDFGLARIAPAADMPRGAFTTAPGMLLGTPAYMAPEQLQGQRSDCASDVFAFGVIVYEYATGRHPFEAATPIGLMARVIESPAPSLASARADLPGSFVTAIDRCLAKSPPDRFRSAVELLDTLANLDSAERGYAAERLTSSGGGGGSETLTGPATTAKAVPASSGVDRSALPVWWRRHQAVVIGLYAVAVLAAWDAKEVHQGWATFVFFLIAAVATVGGVFRGHLLFSNRANHGRFEAERVRARPVTATTDALITLALLSDGLVAAPTRAVPAALLAGLGLGIALARFLIEPSTESGAFGGGR